jgi:hypothetical protein
MFKLQSKPTAGMPVGVLKCTLTPNREDRPRFVALVGYEPAGPPNGDPNQVACWRPVRRVYQWVTFPRDEGGEAERLVCVRVTPLRWRDLQPGQADVEMRDAWLAHVREQKARARAQPPGPGVVP